MAYYGIILQLSYINLMKTFLRIIEHRANFRPRNQMSFSSKRNNKYFKAIKILVFLFEIIAFSPNRFGRQQQRHEIVCCQVLIIGVGRGGGGWGAGGPNLRGGGANKPFGPPDNSPTCTGKTIPLNSILEFSIISYFKMRNVIIWH